MTKKDNTQIQISPLLVMVVKIAFWFVLKCFLIPSAVLKDGICKFMISFASNPDLVNAIECVRYRTKMSIIKAKIKQNAKYIVHSIYGAVLSRTHNLSFRKK